MRPTLLFLLTLLTLTTAAVAQTDTTAAEPEYPPPVFLGRYTSIGDSLEFVKLNIKIGELYQTQLDAALALADSALRLTRKSIVGGDHPNLAESIGNMAVLYYESGLFDKAEPFYIEALAISRRIFKGNHPSLAIDINNMASYYYVTGRYTEAEPLFEEALDIKRRFYKSDHPDLALSINNMASLYNERGRYAEAESLHKEALTMRRRIFKGDYNDLASSINNLAMFYLDRGRYSEAEPLFEEALAMRRRIYKTDHPDLALSINNMAIFYGSRGRHAEAGPLYEEALAMKRRIYETDHPALMTSINNLAHFYSVLGQYERTKSLYEEVLATSRRIFKSDHPDLAGSINNVAVIYCLMDRYAEAEPLIDEALAMARRLYKDDHPNLARTIHSTAFLYSSTNRPIKAEPLYKEARAMYYRVFEFGHPELMECDESYGNFLALNNRLQEAHQLYSEIAKSMNVAMKQSFGFEGEERQLRFLSNVLKGVLEAYSKFCVRFSDQLPKLSAEYLDVLLRFKGAAVNESARLTAEGYENTQAVALIRKLTVLREQEATLATRPPNDELRTELAGIRHRADSLDAALRRLDREYNKFRQRQEVSWNEVQRQLGEKDALIEFAAVPLPVSDKSNLTVMTCVAVVLRQTGEPQIIRLSAEEKLAPFLSKLVKPEPGTSYITDTKRSHELYKLVWQPLEKSLTGIRRAYLVPDGALHRLAFAALVVNDSTGTPVYLDDRYELRQLAGGRELLNRDKSYRPATNRASQKFVLLGNPAFSLDSTNFVMASRLARSEQPKELALRGDYGEERGSLWKELSGAQTEVENIAKICSAKKIEYVVFTSKDALEERVKALSGSSPRVLHLATHGFFFSVSRQTATQRERLFESPLGGGSSLRLEDNPMLRAGLVFAGVNRVWQGAPPIAGVEDGILTALEVSRLNFVGTELATLSACETGRGDVTNGEGIFGLQRAFQVAGAQAILMSLWKIYDQPTAEMMQMFYSAWLGGKSKVEAFRYAKAEMRRKYPTPYFWAGFVLVGE